LKELGKMARTPVAPEGDGPMKTRFPIHIDARWRPFLLVGGATHANSYVQVDDENVTFRFGRLFSRKLPRSEIESARSIRWPIWMGIGWRSNLRGVIGLIGSYHGVVEVRLRTRGRAWRVFPCDRIAVSLEDPEGFMAALERREEPATPREAQPAPARKKAASAARTPRPRRPRTG
jgi:hypothetical protein